MVTDAMLTFSKDQAVTASALSTDVLKMEHVKDVAKGQPVYISVYLSKAFTSSANTLRVDLVAGNTATLTAASHKKLELVPATATSALGAAAEGKLVRFTLPEDIDDEYVGVYYTVSGTLAGGEVSALLTIGGGND